MGNLPIALPNGNESIKTLLKDTVYTPDFTFTLISIGHLDEVGCSATFENLVCAIKNKDGKVMGQLPMSGGLYWAITWPMDIWVKSTNVVMDKMSITKVHRKFRHINYDAIRKMIKSKIVLGVELDSELQPEFCDACTKAKSNVQPFLKQSYTQATEYGQKVHWDLWGPASVRSLQGNSYCVARKDDAS